jgi:hypothetical protein
MLSEDLNAIAQVGHAMLSCGWSLQRSRETSHSTIPPSTQLNNADAGPRSCHKSLHNSILDALGAYSFFIRRFLPNVDFSSSALEGNFVHSHFH